MHQVRFGAISLNRLAYGANVRIRPGPLEAFYLIQIPVCGHADVRIGGQTVHSGPGLGVALNPRQDSDTQWMQDCEQLMVRVPCAQVEQMQSALLGRPLNMPIEFHSDIDCTRHPAWLATLAYLVDMAARPIDLSAYPLLAAQVERLVVTTLLTTLPHNFSGARPTRLAAVLPRHIRRVVDHIDAHPEQPLDPGQLAAIAGVSARSLYAGFRNYCAMTPMQYLHKVRLERVHAELLHAETVRSISHIASNWGFGHLGRFSQDYRARFGELPSQTLQRR
jgi:AraC-like DNA-binding protein